MTKMSFSLHHPVSGDSIADVIVIKYDEFKCINVETELTRLIKGAELSPQRVT